MEDNQVKSNDYYNALHKKYEGIEFAYDGL
jgi:hypothetical protein